MHNLSRLTGGAITDTRSVDELLAFIEDGPRPVSPKDGAAKQPVAKSSSKAAKRQRQRERRRLQSSDDTSNVAAESKDAPAIAHEISASDSNDTSTAGSSSEVRTRFSA